MKKRLLTYGIVIASAGLGITRANAQQTLKIGTNPTKVSNSAVLDVEASNKGVLLPRVALTGTNDVTTIASPANALTVFNTARTYNGANGVMPGYYYWNASSTRWIQLSIPQDLRILANGNHLTQDAGLNGDGTSLGTGYYNIAVGERTLLSNTRGFNNNAFGAAALNANTEGFQNNAFGTLALNKSTTGENNTAVGELSLTENTTGNYNVAVGSYALRNTISGSQNTGLGMLAGMSLTDGNSNTFLGYVSGFHFTNGDGNIFIGNNSGYNLIGSNNNVVIGNFAGYPTSATASDQLFIGNANGDNALIRGDFAANVLTINNTLKVTDLASSASTTTGNNPVVADVNGVLKKSDGSVFQSIRKTTSTSETILASDYTVIFKAASPVTLALPDPATQTGRIIVLVNHSGSGGSDNAITFSNYKISRDPYGTPPNPYQGPTGTLSSSASTMNTVSLGNKMTIQSDGTDWILIGG